MIKNSPDTIIYSPFTGTLKNLSAVPDPAFSGKLLGDGVAIIPKASLVVAPADGLIKSLFRTSHAMVFETDFGIRLFLHIGINTMRLNGKGFKSLVNTGDHVEKGTPLWELNIRYLNRHSTSLCSPILLTNLGENREIIVKAGIDEVISAGSELMSVVPMEED